MNATLRLWIAVLLTGIGAEKASANELNQYQWKKRPILLFADASNAAKLSRQRDILNQNTAALRERDIIVIVDRNATKPSTLRKRFKPRGFTFILVGKDGGEKYRSSKPVSINKIREIIDAMPMRRREMGG